MNTLDSPLEALAFNYGVLTAVNNIWTVVALLTAAVSVWRIRSSVSPNSLVLRQIADSPPPKHSSPPATDQDSSARAESLTASTVSSSYFAVESTDGKTRGKFTVYYNEDNVFESEDIDGVHIDADGDGDVDVDSEGGEGYCNGRECWSESVLRVKLRGDVGWYRYQDLTMLDGNVVKFWESCSPGNGISGLW